MELNTLSRYCDTTFSGVSDRRRSPGAVNDILGRLLAAADLIYALEYEALGKNPAFLDGRAGHSRLLRGEIESRAAVHAALKGSSLWQNKNTGLSGAISIKSGCAVHGAVRDSLEFLREWTEDYEEQPQSLFLITGMSLALDRMNLSLAHLSKLIVNRLLRLTNPLFSELPAYLSQTAGTCLALQEKAAFIDTQISHLSAPTGLYRPALLNEKEDLPRSFEYALCTAERIAGLFELLLATEALSCMKILELRRTKPEGEQTALFYEQLNSCHFEKLAEDETIQRTAELIKNLALFEEGEGGQHKFLQK